LPYPDIQRVVICEIEPLIPKVVSRYFASQNRHVLDDPRTEVIYDDARHFILTTREKFDIITSDPIHPWVKGAATLYTKEYFDLVRRHLNPGGLVTQWVPLYESSSAVVKSEIATFLDAFPNTSIWGNTNNGQGYDTVLLGSLDALKVDLNEIQDRANRPRYSDVLTALTDVGVQAADRPAGNLRRPRVRSRAMARQCRDQPGSGSAAAIPGRLPTQSLSG
jgi:spermidine synthase